MTNKITDEDLEKWEKHALHFTNQAWIHTHVSRLVDTIHALRSARQELKMFQLWGTDGCRKCESGRIELYFIAEYCLDCRSKHLRHQNEQR